MNADEAMDAAQRAQTICHTYNSAANAGFEATDHSTRFHVASILPFNPRSGVWDDVYDSVKESME